jgi:hypothetical protein
MEPHWLTRPETIRRLWHAFIAILAVTVVAEAFVADEPHFAIERLFGFYALFGFVACAALILIARAIGIFLKRPDTYYDEGEGD